MIDFVKLLNYYAVKHVQKYTIFAKKTNLYTPLRHKMQKNNKKKSLFAILLLHK